MLAPVTGAPRCDEEIDIGRETLALAQRFSQDCLIRPPSSAAARGLAVYDDTRQASNAMLLCSRCDVCLMHVVNFDVVGRARNALHQIHRFVTRRATGSEDLNFFPLSLGHTSCS
jgi:hypothetical protein